MRTAEEIDQKILTTNDPSDVAGLIALRIHMTPAPTTQQLSFWCGMLCAAIWKLRPRP